MAIDPDTNRIVPCESSEGTRSTTGSSFEEKLRHLTRKLPHSTEEGIVLPNLVLPNGSPVPKAWTTFTMGELVEIKGYTFRVAYIGETSVLFEPVKPTEPLKES